jgi:hypothetical protein
LRALALSEASRRIVNATIRKVLDKGREPPAAHESADPLALPMEVHSVLMLSSAKVVSSPGCPGACLSWETPEPETETGGHRCAQVNQCLHDRGKFVAGKIADAAYELALLLQRELCAVTHDGTSNTVEHAAVEYYVDFLLRSGRFGPASATSSLPLQVRAALGRWLPTRVGSRCGGRTVAEFTEVCAA